MLYNISKNNGSVYNLNHDPEIELVGTSFQRVYLKGSGTLKLDLSKVFIKAEVALQIRGFDHVIITDGNLNGGLVCSEVKSLTVDNLTITGGNFGIRFGRDDYAENIQLENVHVSNVATVGFWIGNKDSAKIMDRVYINNCSSVACKNTCAQVINVEWSYFGNTILQAINDDRYSKSNALYLGDCNSVELHSNHYTSSRFENVKYLRQS